MTWCVCWGGLYTVIGCTMYVDRWTCTLEPSSFNKRSALIFMWAWSFCWRSQPSTLYQVPRPPHKTSISKIPVWNLCRYNLSITGVFFHADPLLLHLDFCRLICYNVEDLVVFLPKLMNHWIQTCTYCTWFSSLVGYTYILHWVFLTGGLKAVIYTDTLQTVIMVAGAIVLMILSKLLDIYAFTISKKTQIYLYSPIYFNRQALTKLEG